MLVFPFVSLFSPLFLLPSLPFSANRSPFTVCSHPLTYFSRIFRALYFSIVIRFSFFFLSSICRTRGREVFKINFFFENNYSSEFSWQIVEIHSQVANLNETRKLVLHFAIIFPLMNFIELAKLRNQLLFFGFRSNFTREIEKNPSWTCFNVLCTFNDN